MRKGKVRNGLLPNSLKIISSCLKTVSANASTVVRSAGASVAASIAVPAEDEKEQVLWVGFDKLELGPSNLRCILLLGYANGFQVVDVEDGSNVCELVSKRDGPVTFLQMQPTPEKSESYEGFRASHPLLLVVAGDETNGAPLVQGTHLNGFIRDSVIDQQTGSSGPVPTVVRFYSLKSDSYVHVLRFRSAVYLIRCSPRIIAVALASQIYCFDAVTLENKFSVLTCPMPLGGQGLGVNIGYGPMAVGPRWLAYASNNPLMPNTGRLSPQSLTPSPGVSPSTSPGNGSLMARYAVESSKQLAAGLINLGDMGYKTLSKYCQELLPETSNSPLSSNFSRKAGRVTSATPSNETDIAGMVVVKDFVSKAIISQFRAHTSPISALCFDPSGTLLVTASVHGNNINVFRIMPSRTRNVSGSVRYDWNSSHVHLYKLHRGIRTAVIQDICFSQYSQWVAIVSSRGTCHIFVLSPFGGDVSIQAQNLHTEGSFLSSTLSLPWWTSTSCVINSQSPPPPPPIMLSDVSRIRNGCTGWLDTVTNAAAASATGKTSVPSGALAATFHNSFYQNLHPVRSKINLLEHLLVYAPSGHVVQHELLPSVGLESCNSSSRAAPGTVQDEELRVNAEPVQCWAVCRRSNWPEREGSLLTIASDGSETEEVVMDTSDCEDNEMKYAMPFNNTLAGKDLVKNHEKPHWYLSNAEVQLSSGRIPIWQKSKIFFYQMIPSMDNERIFLDDYSGGEIEIEKVAIHEVEIRRKDLLPVFEHFQCAKSNWNDRNSSGGRCLSVSSLEIDQTKDKFIEENIVSLTKSPSIRSVASTNVGSSRITDNLRLDQTTIPHGSTDCSILLGHYVNQIHRQSVSQLNSSSSFLERSQIGEDGSVLKGLSGGSNLVERGITNDGMSGEGLNTYNSPASDDNTEKNGTTESHVPLDFAQYFHEGYCKMLELDDCRELPDVANDADSSSSHCEREKSEEDAHCDDMLGGVFAFSEVD